MKGDLHNPAGRGGMTIETSGISSALPVDGEAAVAPKAVWTTPMLTSMPVSMSEVGGIAGPDSADTLS
ncbi:hypothetical protein ABIE65_003495 [Constrictibacter sp. MBR-5]|jgi:hypothetical protein